MVQLLCLLCYIGGSSRCVKCGFLCTLLTLGSFYAIINLKLVNITYNNCWLCRADNGLKKK